MMTDDQRVLLAHGSGGSMTKDLIDNIFLETFGADPQTQGDDSFVGATYGSQKIAISTDSFVVSPIFFPDADIGRLAIFGTVNDIATSGAKPLYISCGFILEEGFLIEDLKRICASMAMAADEAEVEIVTGDTKVVERGKCDGIYISTTGVGIFENNFSLSGKYCKPGDKILLSGSLGDHGIAVMLAREDMGISAEIRSDAAPLNHLIEDVLKVCTTVRCFRDPTRGGLASTLNELATQSNVCMVVNEKDVVVKPEVQACCEMLGYDFFQVANEGKLVCIVGDEDSQKALETMKRNKYGQDAAIIGEVREVMPDRLPRVEVVTKLGTRRIMDTLVGEQLPRIC